MIVVVMSIALYAAFSDAQNLSLRWFTRDDAYYYFKVAQNISEGHGSTFDGINPTNGYHPLWMLVCIPIFALARFGLILPLRILLLVMSGLSLATGILLYRLIGRVFTPAIGAIAAIYWVFSYDILKRVYQQGLETGIAAFFVMLLVYKLFEFEKTWHNGKASKKQIATLGLVAALAMFSRLDLIFLAVMAGIWVVFRGNPLRHFLLLDIVSIFFSVLLAIMIRIPFQEYYRFSEVAVLTIALSLVINIPIAYATGLYQRSVLQNKPKLLLRIALCTIIGSTLVGLIMIALTGILSLEGFPRTVILWNALILFLFFGTSRLIAFALGTSNPTPNQSDSPKNELKANWKAWFSDGLAYYGVLMGPLGIYMLWNKIAFGTFSPVSGQIKRWWGSLSGRVYGGPSQEALTFFGLKYSGDSNAFHPISTLFGRWAENFHKVRIMDVWRYLIILSIFAIIFYLILSTNGKKAKSAITRLGILPLLCGAWLQIFYYHITGYSSIKEWYWVSQLILVTLLLSLLAGMVYQGLKKIPYIRYALWLLALGYGLYLGFGYWQYVEHTMTYNEWASDQPVNDIAAFLEKHTEPGSIIGMTGGGNAGYFIKDRTVVNMDGLINSYEYFQLLKKKEAGIYFADMGLNYILANITILNGSPYKGQYTPYTEWTDIRYGGKNLLRYHRVPQ